ncbi:MAG: L-threonylcarbamoyladenylate synthase, partial [Brevundimonas sp.]
MTPEAEIQHAAVALKRGELVILPTETVYGLAADAANGEAVARIFEAKGRPRFNPLIAHVADAAQAERIAVLDDRARALADAFWPGPLTIVAPVRDRAAVCDLARAGL